MDGHPIQGHTDKVYQYIANLMVVFQGFVLLLRKKQGPDDEGKSLYIVGSLPDGTCGVQKQDGETVRRALETCLAEDPTKQLPKIFEVTREVTHPVRIRIAESAALDLVGLLGTSKTQGKKSSPQRPGQRECWPKWHHRIGAPLNNCVEGVLTQ